MDNHEWHTGSRWIERQINKPLSILGTEVADILGQAFLGIYHMGENGSEALAADWTAKRVIIIKHGDQLSTVDADILTRLVILCHDRAIRMSIDGATCHGRIRLSFSQRKRGKDPLDSCPAMEDHIRTIRSRIGLPIIEE